MHLTSSMHLFHKIKRGGTQAPNYILLPGRILVVALMFFGFACSIPESNFIKVQKDAHVVLIGNKSWLQNDELRFF